MSQPRSAEFESEKINGNDRYKILAEDHKTGHRGDEFTWKAPSDSDITIMFPPGRDPLGIGTWRIGQGGQLKKHLPQEAVLDWKYPCHYRYAIFCHRTNNFAVMNSDPEIIIVE
ncbi:MAG: hypothetical protein Q8P51_11685 [Ignavibacteria bacterium]|nr:hypothetical protein [Ignavibacteria bacterium]